MGEKHSQSDVLMLGLNMVPERATDFRSLGQDSAWPAYQHFGSTEWPGQPSELGAADL